MTSIESVSEDYSAITYVGPMVPPWNNTAELFDRHHADNNFSAIDNYIKNTTELNKLWVSGSSVSPEFSRLLLLGYVSAVEGYLRNLLRCLIVSNEMVKLNSHTQMIQFGAVLYHKKNVLPEALLEGSFASKDEVANALTKFLSINIKNESRFKGQLEIFDKTCQLRHCCVHRFGKLGSKNAMILGMQQHAHVLEKPITLDFNNIANIASWLMSFTKMLNNYIFEKVLEESRKEGSEFKIEWKWSFRRDKAKYGKIYEIFCTTLDATESPSVEEMYNRFKQTQGKRK